MTRDEDQNLHLMRELYREMYAIRKFMCDMCDPHIFLSVHENLKISPKHHKQEGRFEVSPSIYVTRVFSLTLKIDQLLIS